MEKSLYLINELVVDLVHYNVLTRKEGEKLILGLFILKRLDCLLLEERSKLECLKNYDQKKRLIFLRKHSFYNVSDMSFNQVLLSNTDLINSIKAHLDGYSDDINIAVTEFGLATIFTKMQYEEKYLIRLKNLILELDFGESNIRKYDFDDLLVSIHNQFSNHYEKDIPYDISELITQIIFNKHVYELDEKTPIIISDYCADNGTLLIKAYRYLSNLDNELDIRLQGQEINIEKYCFAKIRMILLQIKNFTIVNSDCILDKENSFYKSTYVVMNPLHESVSRTEYYLKYINDEYKGKEENNRFKGGLTRGQYSFYLYLQHVIYCMDKEESSTSRAVVLSTATPFKVMKGNHSIELSKIRDWLLGEDVIETIISIPPNVFYNTGIQYYLWILDNNKSNDRKGFIKFLNISNFFNSDMRAIDFKNKYIGSQEIDNILDLYLRNEGSLDSKIINKSNIDTESDWLVYLNE